MSLQRTRDHASSFTQDFLSKEGATGLILDSGGKVGVRKKSERLNTVSW